MTLGKALRFCLAAPFVKWGCHISLTVIFANMTSSHVTKECFVMTLPSLLRHLNDGIIAFRAGSHQGQGEKQLTELDRGDSYTSLWVYELPLNGLILCYVNPTSIQNG